MSSIGKTTPFQKTTLVFIIYCSAKTEELLGLGYIQCLINSTAVYTEALMIFSRSHIKTHVANSLSMDVILLFSQAEFNR